MEFIRTYEEKSALLEKQVKGGSITTIDSNFKLIDIIFDFIKDISPQKWVYGLIPPYYPSVANISFDSLDSNIRDLSEILSKYSEPIWYVLSEGVLLHGHFRS